MDNNKYSIEIENDEIIEEKNETDKKQNDKKEKITRTVFDENAPYSNAVVWAVWFFLWPIAWCILSYISLKKLWYYNYARNIFIGTFLWVILFCYIIAYVIDEVPSFSLWFLWLIYMGFQQKYVDEWAGKNPDKKYRNWWKALLWWILWLILYFIIFFMVVFYFDPIFLEFLNNMKTLDF